MRRVERKAGEGSKRRDVLLVRVSRTFRNCDVFVDEFVGARLFEFGSRNNRIVRASHICSKSYSRSRILQRLWEFLEGESKS